MGNNERLPEFPTDWHQESYIVNLKRELEGAELRGEDDYAANVKAELARVEGKPKAAKKEPEPKPEKAPEPEPEKEPAGKGKSSK